MKIMKLKIFLWIAVIGSTVILTSCGSGSNEVENPDKMTFEDVESEFYFGKPLSELSKRNILLKYGSVCEFWEVLISQQQDRLENGEANFEFVKGMRLKNISKHELLGETKSAGWCQGFFKLILWNDEEDLDVEIGQYTLGNDYILDDAEDCSIELPYSCRLGACGTCAGILNAGCVNQDDQVFLDDDQLERGFVLLCVARATCDYRIETHAEDKLF